ncbi:CDP-alcohol phosphatidyltransferase family protein [Actinoplanes sp. NPDC020271]|uniref:CDP-alcohol phosphatidyltransferase family protein n=1 Tax=Actinoplanes sp. NPDC020271 TaxID=3363896 RepID=UPI0037A2EBA5
MRVPLAEIRERTYKPVDAWWTVLLVDPLASRLVWLIAPYRRVTPNVLTLVATVLGAGAAVAFARGDRWSLVAGAVLFHLSFVADCMDGKIARLNGTGTIFGQWLDFVLDRVRVFFCALALFGGQYARGHDVTYLWMMAVAIFLDLIRYVNGGQVAKVRSGMAAEFGAPAEPRGGTAARLRRHRIRTHLFSGIEYEMFVYLIGPLTGLILPVTAAAGAAMLFFELIVVLRLFQAARLADSLAGPAPAEHTDGHG